MAINEKEIGSSTSEIIGGGKGAESIVDVKDREKEEKIGGELGSWLKKVEEYNSDPEGMVVRDGNIKMVAPDKISQDAYKISITKSNFISNISKKRKNVGEAINWFVTFFLRVIKLKKGKVVFKEDESQ